MERSELRENGNDGPVDVIVDVDLDLVRHVISRRSTYERLRTYRYHKKPCELTEYMEKMSRRTSQVSTKLLSVLVNTQR